MKRSNYTIKCNLDDTLCLNFKLNLLLTEENVKSRFDCTVLCKRKNMKFTVYKIAHYISSLVKFRRLSWSAVLPSMFFSCVIKKNTIILSYRISDFSCFYWLSHASLVFWNLSLASSTIWTKFPKSLGMDGINVVHSLLGLVQASCELALDFVSCLRILVTILFRYHLVLLSWNLFFLSLN